MLRLALAVPRLFAPPPVLFAAAERTTGLGVGSGCLSRALALAWSALSGATGRWCTAWLSNTNTNIDARRPQPPSLPPSQGRGPAAAFHSGCTLARGAASTQSRTTIRRCKDRVRVCGDARTSMHAGARPEGESKCIRTLRAPWAAALGQEQPP